MCPENEDFKIGKMLTKIPKYFLGTSLWLTLLVLLQVLSSCNEEKTAVVWQASPDIVFPPQLSVELADAAAEFEKLSVDTSRINFLFRLSNHQPIFQNIIFKHIISQTKDRSLIKLHILAYRSLSRSFSELNELDSVTWYCNEGLRLCGSDSTCNDLRSEFYRDLGNVNANFSNNAEAITNFEKAIEIASESGNVNNIAQYIAETGRVYLEMNETEKARDCYEKGRRCAEKYNNTSLLIYSLNSLGDLCRREQKVEESIRYFQQSNRAHFVKTGIPYEKWACTSMGKSYTMMQQYDSARKYFNRSIDLATDQGAANIKAQAYMNISVCDYNQNLPLDAIRNGLKAEEVSEDIPQLDIKSAVAENLYFLYKKTGQFEKAIVYLENLKALEDSMQTSTDVKKFAEAEFKTKEIKLLRRIEQEQTVRELETRRQRIIIFSITLILLISVVFVAFVFRSLRQIRAKNKIIEEKQKEIVESITYARRIQNSLLPSEKYIERILNKLKNGK